MLAASVMGADLIGAFHRPPGDARGPGGWWLLNEPELHFYDDVIVPDQAGWRRERLPVVPKVAAMTLAPDWVCEVVSPSSAAIDRVKKARIYARNSVRWQWIIDPIGKTLDADELRDGAWALLGTWGPGEKPRVPPFDAIELELDAWWGITAASP